MSKESKSKLNRKLFQKKTANFRKKSAKRASPGTLPTTPPNLKDNAYYTVSRSSSKKMFFSLQEENNKNRTSLDKSEEKINLYNHQLSYISQNTSSAIGSEYFNNLVESLASVFGTRYAFISMLQNGSQKILKTVALWDKDKISENLTFNLKGTPCEKVIAQESGFYPDKIQKYFPDDRYLIDWNIQSYMGVPLLDLDKQPFGVLSLMDEKPIEDHEHLHSILNIFAARCSSEIERMDAEAKLKSKTLELEKSNSALKDFVFIASHDLNEPLRKLVTFGSRLVEIDESLNPKSKDYLEIMQKTAFRMQNLIDDLLLFSRASTQSDPFKKINLKTVMKEVLTDLDQLIQKNAGSIQVGSLPTVNGDAFQMKQLFQNLLSNAIKFHNEEQPPKIEINSHINNQNAWEISIKDYGIGFDKKYSDRIFRPFERLHGKGKYEGTGMGLAICKQIASNHGGSIFVESQPGEGSCFSVLFPSTTS